MTYLELVNSVLVRLREREVSAVTENTYSKLVGEFVNDAKEEIENAWDWSHLRTTLTATTVADIFAYTLTSSGTRLKVLNVVNDTSNWFMEYKSAEEFTNLYLNYDNVDTGSPRYYSFNGLDANNDTIAEVYPKPDAQYELRFNLVVRPGPLTNNSDVLYAPERPVIMLAYAKALEERGEDGGVTPTGAYLTANRMLNDAISFDQEKHSEELVFRAV
jgi:hypothetical protein